MNRTPFFYHHSYPNPYETCRTRKLSNDAKRRDVSVDDVQCFIYTGASIWNEKNKVCHRRSSNKLGGIPSSLVNTVGRSIINVGARITVYRQRPVSSTYQV